MTFPIALEQRSYVLCWCNLHSEELVFFSLVKSQSKEWVKTGQKLLQGDKRKYRSHVPLKLKGKLVQVSQLPFPLVSPPFIVCICSDQQGNTQNFSSFPSFPALPMTFCPLVSILASHKIPLKAHQLCPLFPSSLRGYTEAVSTM